MSDSETFDASQQARIHALNLATALHKDTMRLHKDELHGIGDMVLADAANFAEFITSGALPPSGSQESDGGTK